jgi:hypothetical protein
MVSCPNKTATSRALPKLNFRRDLISSRERRPKNARARVSFHFWLSRCTRGNEIKCGRCPTSVAIWFWIYCACAGRGHTSRNVGLKMCTTESMTGPPIPPASSRSFIRTFSNLLAKRRVGSLVLFLPKDDWAPFIFSRNYGFFLFSPWQFSDEWICFAIHSKVYLFLFCFIAWLTDSGYF